MSSIISTRALNDASFEMKEPSVHRMLKSVFFISFSFVYDAKVPHICANARHM